MLIWELIFSFLTITYHKFYHIMSRVKMIKEFRQDNMAVSETRLHDRFIGTLRIEDGQNIMIREEQNQGTFYKSTCL